MTTYRADKVKFMDRQTEGQKDGWTYGHTQATTIPLRPERPRGKNDWSVTYGAAIGKQIKFHTRNFINSASTGLSFYQIMTLFVSENANPSISKFVEFC